MGAGIAQIPLGGVSSDQLLGVQGADLIASYRNVGDIDLWGADFAFQASLTNRWSVGGSYSHISEDYIQITGHHPSHSMRPRTRGRST